MSVKQEAVKRAVKLLEAAGAQFHVKLGDLELGEPLSCEKQGRTPWKNKGVADHVRSYLAELAIGQSVVIPLDRYDIASVQSTAGWAASKMYGKGCYITSRTEEGLEVLRVM